MTTRKLLTFTLIFFMLCVSVGAAAQGQTSAANHQAKLQALSQDLFQRNLDQRQKARDYAQRVGISMRRDLPGGGVLELQGLSNGQRPVFYITNNLDAADTVSTLKVWPGSSAGLNLDGSGMTVGVWDGGAIYADHPDFIGRLLQMDGATTVSGHSTHVAGTLIGSGAGLEPRSRGMAFASQLHAWDWSFDTSEMAAAAAGGLLTSNHSYGIAAGWLYIGDVPPNNWWWIGGAGDSDVEDPYFGYYDSESQLWDQIAYNAPYYLIVKAAGNDRSDTGPSPGEEYTVIDQEGSPLFTSTLPRNADCAPLGYDCLPTNSVAKNILTVGAVDDIPGGYSPLAGPSQVLMAPFSSWGPSDDGRIKPDLVGNGVFLISAWPEYPYYAAAAGTSMAAPNVTGSLILLQQHYQDLHGPGNFMRGATLKALAIHTADEAGDGDGPDYAFGWGLLNTRSAAQLISGDGVDYQIIEGSLAQGATDTVQFEINDEASVLSATLVWMDPPATPVPLTLDPPDLMLVNDLDLRITRGPAIYLPWVLNPADPTAAATRGDNFRDNVEKVEVVNGGTGVYTVSVSHKGSLFNGVNQDYSLIIGTTPAPPSGSNLLIDEDFSGGMPVGWSVDTAMGIPWAINSPVAGDPRLDNGTGGSGNFAMVDNGWINQTVTSLVTPALDLSSASAVVLRFNSYYNYDTFESLNVDTSSDGGFSWGNAWRFQGFNPFPTPYTLDLSGAIAGAGNARVRFRFDSEGWLSGDFWQVDDVELDVFGGTPPAGDPPGAASAPNPDDGSSSLPVNTILSWSAGELATSHDVYFGTDSTPDASEFQGNQGATGFDPGILANATTYYWRIDEVNDDGNTGGNVWSFSTEAAPLLPGFASNPTPANGSMDVSTSIVLGWVAGSNTSSHDVYFGPAPSPVFIGNQGGTMFNPGELAESTTYMWRIDEVNGQGTSTGPEWSFTTGTAASQTIFHISAIDIVTAPVKGPRNRGVATISVQDTEGSAVTAVDLSGTFSGDWSGIRSGTTDSAGQLIVETPPVKNGNNWQFCVDTASKIGAVFDIEASAGLMCAAPAASGSVSGLVTDISNANPIAGASVSADSGQSVITAADGSYSLSNVPVGNRNVTFSASGYDPTVLPVSVIDGGDSTLDASLTPTTSGGGTGTIKGTVTDSSGAKVNGALIQVLGGPSSTTNKGGKYGIQNVPEGEQSITASHPDHGVTAPQLVIITAGATTTLNISFNP